MEENFDRICPVCKTTLNDFLESGFLGCENCYKVFKDEIIKYIDESQNSCYHVGKIILKNNSKENDNE